MCFKMQIKERMPSSWSLIRNYRSAAGWLIKVCQISIGYDRYRILKIITLLLQMSYNGNEKLNLEKGRLT
jgi:hypothetical protein